MSEERCETCGLMSRKWMDWMRSLPSNAGSRLEDHCRCAETRQAEIDGLSANLSKVMEENARLREALEPFAKVADEADEGVSAPFPDHTWLYAIDDELTLGECRRARFLLSREG